MITKRRIEITVFRRQRLALTQEVAQSSDDPATTAVDEHLVEELTTLVKRLTGESLACLNSTQTAINADNDSESESR